MDLEAVLKVLTDIGRADGTSYVIVGTLTMLAFVVMRAMLPVKGLSVVYAPALFWGGLSGIYASSYAGVVYSSDRSSNEVAGAMLGMIAALVVMMALTHLVIVAARIRRPVTNAVARARP